MLKTLLDAGYKELKRCSKIADQVDALQEEYKLKTDEELQGATAKFRERLKNGETLDDLIVEAYATVREASTRVLHMTPFRVQVIGALALHGGNIAEMKTGEGKTLTSTMVAYLNALPGEGVHIVTVNEYLARRDATEMGELFKWLGLTVGLNIREISPDEKRAQYACDITYSTNNELGFDYLRDHMAIRKEDMVQRPLNFAIVDEVDSILVDEARTPLIISGQAKQDTFDDKYRRANNFVRGLKPTDYDIDIKAKTISLTDEGMLKAEKYFNMISSGGDGSEEITIAEGEKADATELYTEKNADIVHRINNALRANYIMQKDIDYVVQDNTVIIVDAFTGRLMHGRQYTEGLHQALEAKENVDIKKETVTVATITFQNFFRMYKKLAGMTGTAKTEEEEFRNIYNMYVVEVPTNLPVIRIDAPDFMYATKKAKFNAIANDIAERHEKGQPVLVGTIAIETSELLSDLLKRRGIKHDVLNAKQHEREAEIIAKAGYLGAVTIATNMAGRGTDIKLGPGVKEVGGLAVIGTERHESRRIDNQLRGRSGRQGDPGFTRFYLSAEDDLMKRFGSERFKTLLAMMSNRETGEEVPLESKMFSKFVESAQKKIEGSNYDARKNVLEYDEVLRKQREIIYGQRDKVLFYDDITDVAVNMIENCLKRVVSENVDYSTRHHLVNAKGLVEAVDKKYLPQGLIQESDFEGLSVEQAASKLMDISKALLGDKKTNYPPEIYQEFLKAGILGSVDKYWIRHIDEMDGLRQAVRLQSYAQIDPLREYQEIAFERFNEMLVNIEATATTLINCRVVHMNVHREQAVKQTFASSGKEEKKVPVRVGQKVGRNDPCPCGSGKKYKNCCGK